MTERAAYNTNLAAEYYALSVLYRKGAEAYLTVGNKKAVDIVVRAKDGRALSLDVKGLAGTTCWPIDNLKPAPNHYVLLVSYLNDIGNEHRVPEVYIVPSQNIEREHLDYRNPKRNRHVVQLARMREAGTAYLNNWDVFQR